MNKIKKIGIPTLLCGSILGSCNNKFAKKDMFALTTYSSSAVGMPAIAPAVVPAAILASRLAMAAPSAIVLPTVPHDGLLKDSLVEFFVGDSSVGTNNIRYLYRETKNIRPEELEDAVEKDGGNFFPVMIQAVLASVQEEEKRHKYKNVLSDILKFIQEVGLKMTPEEKTRYFNKQALDELFNVISFGVRSSYEKDMGSVRPNLYKIADVFLENMPDSELQDLSPLIKERMKHNSYTTAVLTKKILERGNNSNFTLSNGDVNLINKRFGENPKEFKILFVDDRSIMIQLNADRVCEEISNNSSLNEGAVLASLLSTGDSSSCDEVEQSAEILRQVKKSGGCEALFKAGRVTEMRDNRGRNILHILTKGNPECEQGKIDMLKGVGLLENGDLFDLIGQPDINGTKPLMRDPNLQSEMQDIFSCQNSCKNDGERRVITSALESHVLTEESSNSLRNSSRWNEWCKLGFLFYKMGYLRLAAVSIATTSVVRGLKSLLTKDPGVAEEESRREAKDEEIELEE